MKGLLSILILLLFSSFCYAQSDFEFEFGEEFNLSSVISQNLDHGKPIKWINVNTEKGTWTVKGDSLIDSGRPTGVVRSERQYENFILHVEWKHLDPGGNSGVFVWSNGDPAAIDNEPYPSGIEVQMLDLDWVKLHKKNGVYPPIAYVHGELFGVGGVKIVPDNPRGKRSKAIENRAKGTGEWNTYDVVCVDGVVKLSVNGKFVNGISHSTQKRGYLCLESEGGEIHFRNLKIIELPPGVTYPSQAVPILQ